MAHLNRWTLVVGGACAILAAWLIPPESRYFDGYLLERQTPERRAYRHLNRRVSALNEELRQRRAAEFVEGVVSEAAPEPGSTFIHFGEEYWEGARAAVRDSLEAALEREGPRRDEVVSALVLLPEEFGNHGGIRGNSHSSPIFVDMDGPVPYCATVVRYNPGPFQGYENHPRGEELVARGAKIGVPVCSWFLRHGRPGAEVTTWVIERGFLALGARGTYAGDFAGPDRHAFGIMPWSGHRRSALPCMAGRLEACAAGVGLIEGSRWSGTTTIYKVPNWAYTESYGGGDYGGREKQIFDELEDEFGEEAFGRFWRSDAPVDEAFEAAFGVSFPQWIHEWSRGDAPALAAGPGVDFDDLGLALLTILSLMAVAVMVAKKRTV